MKYTGSSTSTQIESHKAWFANLLFTCDVVTKNPGCDDVAAARE